MGQETYFKKPQLQKLTNFNALLELIQPQISAKKLNLKSQQFTFSEFAALFEIRISTKHHLKATHFNIIFMKLV
jgi:hypothetical protein